MLGFFRHSNQHRLHLGILCKTSPQLPGVGATCGRPVNCVNECVTYRATTGRPYSATGGTSAQLSAPAVRIHAMLQVDQRGRVTIQATAAPNIENNATRKTRLP
jgi:hypothetical protein